MTAPFDVHVVEDQVHLTLAELCRACRMPEEQIHVWVVEGVLSPIGESPPQWRFGGPALRRARLAWTLTAELDLNPQGVALALDLLDEIAALKGHLRREGLR